MLRRSGTPEQDRIKEKQFVFGGRVAETANEQATPVTAQAGAPAGREGGNTSSVRVPLTTRLRPELAATLKRVSLERQLAGVHPFAVQDLVEQALQAWLAANEPVA